MNISMSNGAWNLLDELVLRNHFNKPTVDPSRSMEVKDDVLTMEFEVPGLSKKDINVKVEDTVLSIKGENETRTFNKKYNISEDWDVSKTSAKVKDGILSISIPKVEEKKSKIVEVTVK